MLAPKYTTIDRILEKVRSEGFEEVYRDEVIEWVWDVVGYLGIVQALEDKYVEIDFDNYYFYTPADLFKIEAIREKSSQVALKRSSDLFHILNQDTYAPSMIRLEGESTAVGGAESTAFVATDSQYLRVWQLSYLEKDTKIYIGFKEGTLQMAYKAFPVDEAGFPKIPDDAKYIRAVVDYLCMKISKRMMLKDQLSERKYEKFKEEYYFSAASARTSAQMPDMDLMEAIKNRSLRLIPTITEHRSNFRFLGEGERLNKI